jgi:hypothetical protein
MRGRTTWLLALVTMLVGLALVWEERAPTPRKADSLLPVPADTITSIRIERPGESVVLAKKAGVWRITEPLHALADAKRVAVLLETLATPGEFRAVEVKNGDKAVFGLDPPRATLRLTAGERELPAILLGRQTPLGNRAYIQRGDSSETLLGSSDIPFAANRGFQDLRSRQVLPGELNPTEVRLRRPNLPEIALRAVGEKWQIIAPYNAPASTAAMARWITAIRDLKASSFFDNPSPEDLDAYGFAPAPLEIDWTDAQGNHRLWIGGPNLRAGDDEIWIRTEQHPTLYSVPRAQIAPIDLTPEPLRDKSLIGFHASDIHALTLRTDDLTEIRLERRGEQWLANGAPATTAVVDRYLADTLMLAGEQTLSTAGGPEHFGLDQPKIVLTFEDVQGATLARLLVGEIGGKRTITREGTRLIYSLPANSPGALEKRLSDFR